MRIEFGIRISMMKPVHYGIRPRTHIVGTLCEIGENKKETFPENAHLKCAMRCITVIKKGLSKQGNVPHGKKENNNEHKLDLTMKQDEKYNLMKCENREDGKMFSLNATMIAL